MAQGDVGALGVAASLLLVAVAVVLSMRGGLGLERSLVWASARALVQLLIVGVALAAVIDPDSPIALSWLWVAAMVAFSADVARRRAPEVPGMLGLAAVAFAATGVVALGTVFGLGVFPLEGRTLVPIAGLVIGNSMAATVLAARGIVEELRDRRLEVEARLALGQPGTPGGAPVRADGAPGRAGAPDRDDEGRRHRVPARGDDGPHPGRRQPAERRARAGGGDVPGARVGGDATAVVAEGLVRRLFTPDHRLVRLRRPADG